MKWMPKTTPIMFAPESIRAIIAGRKTQTRRVVQVPPEIRETARLDQATIDPGGTPIWGPGPYLKVPWTDETDEELRSRVHCPYGYPEHGDLLWVREPWRVEAALNDLTPSECPSSTHVWYDATDEIRYTSAGKLRSARYMTRWASRLTLELVRVRVERVQAITPADACAEGVFQDGHYYTEPPMPYPVASFKALWDTINGKRAPWASNPWVWALEFKLVGSDVGRAG